MQGTPPPPNCPIPAAAAVGNQRQWGCKEAPQPVAVTTMLRPLPTWPSLSNPVLQLHLTHGTSLPSAANPPKALENRKGWGASSIRSSRNSPPHSALPESSPKATPCTLHPCTLGPCTETTPPPSLPGHAHPSTCIALLAVGGAGKLFVRCCCWRCKGGRASYWQCVRQESTCGGNSRCVCV